MDQTVRWICATPATTYKTFKQNDSRQEAAQFWASFVRTTKPALPPLWGHLVWVGRLLRKNKKILEFPLKIPTFFCSSAGP